MKYFIISVICVAACGLCGCNNNESVEILRMDSAAAGGEIISDKIADGVVLWQNYCGAGDESVDSFWTGYSRSEAVKVFYPDVEERIEAKIPDIEKELGTVKLAMAKKFPDISFPKKVYAVVSPYSQSIMLSDSVMLIALNHYLGADYPGYAAMAEEQKLLKLPEYIKNDVAESLLRSKYAFAGNEWSPALNKMVYEGAIALSVKEITGCKLNEAIGISSENLKLLKSKEKDIWKKLVEAQMIYSTSPRVSDELIKPYPARRFPSRVGRYIGYWIAESAHRQDFSYKDLLSPDFYMSDDVLKWYK